MGIVFLPMVISSGKNLRRSLVWQSGTLLTEFDEALWNATVESVTVSPGQESIFTFKDG